MRCYDVSAEVDTHDETGKVNGSKVVFQFAATQADSKAARDAMMAEHGLKKKDVDIEEIEVPVNPKADLIEFLNKLASGNYK